MSKIQELIKDNKSVIVFDVDGVLARLEFGEYNHFDLSDEEWTETLYKGDVYYNDDYVMPTMVNYIKTRDINDIYVCSKTYTDMENNIKIDYLTKNYGILKENIYFVSDNDDKVKALYKIKEKYPDLDDKYIVMVDDTVSVLDSVKANSGFSTVHISSFV